MNFSSKLIEDAVNEFSRLPGIGVKTALRLVLHLLKSHSDEVKKFGNTIIKMREDIKFCPKCYNVSDDDGCSICDNPSREHSVICLVESIRDVIAIENTNQYNGLYHVLGGVISPIDGIGPEHINVDSLIKRVETGDVKEIIMAISPTIEGDTTIFFLTNKLEEFNVKITTIARGISFGGELEYADELTLARSIVTRLPYENYLVNRE